MPQKFLYKNRFDRFDKQLTWNNFFKEEHEPQKEATRFSVPLFRAPAPDDLKKAIQNQEVGNLWCPECGSHMKFKTIIGKNLEQLMEDGMTYYGYQIQRFLQCPMSSRRTHACSCKESFPYGGPIHDIVATQRVLTKTCSQVSFRIPSSEKVREVMLCTIPLFGNSTIYTFDPSIGVREGFELEATVNPDIFVLRYRKLILEINTFYLEKMIDQIWDLLGWFEDYACHKEVLTVLYNFYIKDTEMEPKVELSASGLIIQGVLHKYFIDFFGIPSYFCPNGELSKRLCLVPTQTKEFRGFIDPEVEGTLKEMGKGIKWLDLLVLAKTFYLAHDQENAAVDSVFRGQVIFDS
jgi:hypothetical protein